MPSTLIAHNESTAYHPNTAAIEAILQNIQDIRVDNQIAFTMLWSQFFIYMLFAIVFSLLFHREKLRLYPPISIANDCLFE